VRKRRWAEIISSFSRMRIFFLEGLSKKEEKLIGGSISENDPNVTSDHN
jgi:hypothetical protein